MFTQRHFQVKMNEKKSYLNINVQNKSLENKIKRY